MKHRLAVLTDEIAREESRLARLEVERTTILSRLRELRGELAALEAGTIPSPEPSTLSSTEKMALFRSLFKGGKICTDAGEDA